MIRRQIHLPADPTTVWEAITTPDHEWFGARVEWDLRPGGAARFHDDEHPRAGVVEEVEPGRALRFTWWPEDDCADRSEVAYELDGPDEREGTTLTVTERQVAAPAPASACLSIGAGRWDPADDQALAAWAAAVAGVLELGAAPVSAGGGPAVASAPAFAGARC